MLHPSLPNELFLNVLSYLDYFDLKKCCRLNKEIAQAIQQELPYADAFRSPPISNFDFYSQGIETHPLFESNSISFDCTVARPAEDAVVLRVKPSGTMEYAGFSKI